jgi:hypothetical protein
VPDAGPPASTVAFTQVLAQEAGNLANLAGACAAAPPPGYSSAGLERLAAHAATWAETLGDGRLGAPSGGVPGASGPSGPSGSASGEAGCDAADLDRAARRTQTEAARLARDSGRGAALNWALAADLALTAGPNDLEDPGVGGLLLTAGDTLANLVLAEDQAGFVEEFLAARAAEPDRAKLVAAAQTHRLRAESMAAQLARDDATDPRAAAYTLPKAETPESIQQTAAQVEYALASQYATVPDQDAAAGLVRWQLLQAAGWGYDLPAWPFTE